MGDKRQARHDERRHRSSERVNRTQKSFKLTPFRAEMSRKSFEIAIRERFLANPQGRRDGSPRIWSIAVAKPGGFELHAPKFGSERITASAVEVGFLQDSLLYDLGLDRLTEVLEFFLHADTLRVDYSDDGGAVQSARVRISRR